MFALILLDSNLERYYLEDNNPPGIKLIFKILEKYNIKYQAIDYKKIEYKEYIIPDIVLSLIIPTPEDKKYIKLKEYFEDKTKYINSYKSVNLVKNKYKTLQFINNKLPNIKTPKTYFKSEYKHNLDFPLIAKPNTGYKGEDVRLIENSKDLNNVSEDYIIQEAIVESFGCDIRIVVFLDEFLYSIERENIGDFRSNKNQGGSIAEFKPPEFLVKQALSISKVLNLKYAGVDFLVKNDEFVLCEVNSFPGLSFILDKINFNDYKIIDKAIKSFLDFLR